MIILNQDLIWTFGGDINPLFARYGYTATLTREGLIIYIGGVYQNGSYANMNEVCLGWIYTNYVIFTSNRVILDSNILYDAKKDRWSNQMEIIHSAVLSKNLKCFIYIINCFKFQI